MSTPSARVPGPPRRPTRAPGQPRVPAKIERELTVARARIGFRGAVIEAAQAAGGEFLFEIPAIAFGAAGGRAAVIRPHGQDRCDTLIYVLCGEADGLIEILNEDEVPAPVAAMTWSYARVLEQLSGQAPAAGWSLQ